MATPRQRIEVLFPRHTQEGESWQNPTGNVAIVHRRGSLSWAARVDGSWVALIPGGDSSGSLRDLPEVVDRLARMLAEAMGLHVLFDVPRKATSVHIRPE